MNIKKFIFNRKRLVFHAIWRSCTAICLFLSAALGQDLSLNEKSSVWNVEAGVDSWVLSPSVSQDAIPNYLENNTNLFLANSHTAWHYKSQSPYAKVLGDANLTQHLTFSLRTRADQQVGMRVDAVNLAWEISPQLGLRAGVTDYKTSWCRTYDTDSPWLQEIDTPCSTALFQDVTGGAPGAQVFTRQNLGNYLVQTQIGVYRPRWLGHTDQEFGFAVPSKQFQVTANDKWGVSLNALDLEQGTEFRAAYIHAKQQALSPEPQIQGNTTQAYDLIYLATDFALSAKTQLRLTHTQQNLNQTCRSSVALMGLCNWNSHMQASANSIELTHQLDSKNLLAGALSAFDMQLEEDFFNKRFDVLAQYPNGLGIQNQRAALAWRHEWTNHIFSTFQWVRAKADSSHFASHLGSSASAMGFRLAYRY